MKTPYYWQWVSHEVTIATDMENVKEKTGVEGDLCVKIKASDFAMNKALIAAIGGNLHYIRMYEQGRKTREETINGFLCMFSCFIPKSRDVSPNDILTFISTHEPTKKAILKALF